MRQIKFYIKSTGEVIQTQLLNGDEKPTKDELDLMMQEIAFDKGIELNELAAELEE